MKNLLIASLTILLAACAPSTPPADSSLLSTVPADAPVVAVADLYMCAADMGMRISADGLFDASGGEVNLKKIPASIADPLSALIRRHRAVDLSHVAIFTDPRTDATVFTAMRIDGAELAEEPEDSPVALFADDGRVWAVAKPFTQANLDSLVARSSRRSLADVERDCEFFTTYRPIRAVVRVPQFRNVAGDDFTSVYIASSIDETALTLRLTYANASGETVDPFSLLSPIDGNVYSYLPPATVATFALGADRNTFRTILSNYGGAMPLRQRMAAELSSGFLCDSASTIAVGFAPGGSAETISNFSLDTWVFTALLPIEIERTEDFIDIIDKLTQGTVESDIAGAYLAVSNASLEQVASGDDYGSAPSASSIRFMAVMPFRSELMKALGSTRGLSIDAQCSQGATTIRISVLGGDEPPGQVLYNLFTKFQAKKKNFAL